LYYFKCVVTIFLRTYSLPYSQSCDVSPFIAIIRTGEIPA